MYLTRIYYRNLEKIGDDIVQFIFRTQLCWNTAYDLRHTYLK